MNPFPANRRSTKVFSPGRSFKPTPTSSGDLSSLLKVLSTRLMFEPASMLMRLISEIFRPARVPRIISQFKFRADRAGGDDFASAPVFGNIKFAVLPDAQSAAAAQFADPVVVLRRPVECRKNSSWHTSG